MVALAMIASLVEKLDHRIPDIQDRSMRAICLKVLSPLGESDRVDSLAVIPGLAHAILQWLNDRYAIAPSALVSDCLSLVKTLVSESESLRTLFREAGGAAFMKEFAAHNASHSSTCMEISLILDNSAPLLPVVSASAVSSIPQKPEAKMADLEEERLFDLGVRIKFCTSMSDEASIDDLAGEVRFGIGSSVPHSAMAKKPYILEALLCQLSGNGPSASPVTELGSIGQALNETCSRIKTSELHADLVTSMIVSSLDSLLFRPNECELARHVALTALGDRPAGSLEAIGDKNLEAIVDALVRVTRTAFPEDSYKEERFTFADQTWVCLRKMIDWSLYHEIVAEIVIQVLHATASPETAWMFSQKGGTFLTHVTNWIADEGFYNSGNPTACKQLASKGAIAIATLDPLNQSDFLRAREVLLALKKLSISQPVLSDSELDDLFSLWLKVPELFPDNGDPLAFIRKVFSVNSRVVTMLAKNKELGEAFITFMEQSKQQSSLNTQLMGEFLLRTQCWRPASLVAVMNEKFGFTLPLLAPGTVDGSMEGLARSLFAHSEAVRKQASLVLWKSTQQSGTFVADPWRSCTKDPLRDYALGRMNVDMSEIQHAIGLALNERLGVDVRSASAVQACTLLTSSQVSCQTESVIKVLKAIQTVDDNNDLTVALCHLATLLLDNGANCAVSLPAFISSMIRHLFSENEERTVAVMHLLSRLVFTRETVLGSLSSCGEDLYKLALKRIDQTSYHALRPLVTEISPEKQAPETVSLKTFAICVSLYGLSDMTTFSKIENVDEDRSLLVRLATPPLVARSAGDRSLLSQCRRFTEEVIWPIKRNPEKVCPSAVVNAVSMLIDTASCWAPSYPLFACECLDLLTLVISRSVGNVKLAELAVLPMAVCNFLKRADPTSMSKPVNCGYKLLLVLTTVPGLDMTVCCDLASSVVDQIKKSETASAIACLWLAITQEALRQTIIDQIANVGEFSKLLLGLRGSSLATALRVRLVGLLTPKCESVEEIVLGLFLMAEEPLVLAEVTHLVQQTVPRADWEINVSDWFEVSTEYQLEARLKVATSIVDFRGPEIAHSMIQADVWPSLFARSRSPSLLDFAVACLKADRTLFAYLSHAGLFTSISFSPCLADLLEIVRQTFDDPSSNLVVHCQPALDWLGCPDCIELIADILSQQRTAGYRTVELAASLIGEQGLALQHSSVPILLAIANSLSSFMDHPRLCSMVTLLFRIPGIASDADPEISSNLITLMRVHESSVLGNENELFFAQIRLISSWVSAVSRLSPALVQAYSDWFCCLWKKALLTPSFVPVLTELVCGLIEVLASADLQHPAWGPPLSHVLSFATRTEGVPTVLLSLCMSAAESASSILVNKAVTGRVVAALISSNGNGIAKLCASLVGCRQTAAEVLKHVDSWMNVVDSDLLVRVIGSIVLAGGHSRTAVATCDDLIAFLVKQSPQNHIATNAISVLSSTNIRCQQAVAGNGG